LKLDLLPSKRPKEGSTFPPFQLKEETEPVSEMQFSAPVLERKWNRGENN
jgi:hypothetical protein